MRGGRAIKDTAHHMSRVVGFFLGGRAVAETMGHLLSDDGWGLYKKPLESG